MSKLILALSTFNPNSSECKYGYPGCAGETEKIPGTQTNDAPVKYLLKRGEEQNKEIEEILCLTTGKAKKNSYKHFQGMLSKVGYKGKLIKIEYDEYNREKEASALNELLGHIGPEDKIYLDTTGAFRDLANLLVLVARLIAFRGNELLMAVYSYYDKDDTSKNEVRDVTYQYKMLDTIGGMGECVSYGQTAKLIGQWNGVPGASDLLKAMQDITDAATLCKTNNLNKLYKNLNDALRPRANGADINAVLLEQMKAVFRKKFGLPETGPATVDDIRVIHWCLDNGMLQQAITLYTERIPAWIMNHEILKIHEEYVKNIPELKSKPDYQDEAIYLFLNYFLWFFSNRKLTKNEDKEQKYKSNLWNVDADADAYKAIIRKYRKEEKRQARRKQWHCDQGANIETMEEWVCAGSPFITSYKKENLDNLKRVARDYWYIKEQRNRYNHALDEPSKGEEVKQYFEDIKDEQGEKMYPWGDEVTVDKLTATIKNALKHLEKCAEEAEK